MKILRFLGLLTFIIVAWVAAFGIGLMTFHESPVASRIVNLNP